MHLVPTPGTMEPRILETRDLGLMDYVAAHSLQKKLVEEKKLAPNTPDYLLLVEHPDVYTYGRKSKNPDRSLCFVDIERGGEDTFHTPGQIVGYPILSLDPAERDLHHYLRNLEAVLMDTLNDFGVPSFRRDNATGVWVTGEKKIASLGVAVSGWVTYHGFALNVDNDLSGFTKISPCGFKASVMTSLKEVMGAHCPDKESIKSGIRRHFSRRLGRTETPLTV